MASASQAGLEIDLRSIPLAEGIGARDALVSGEEYELLIAAPAPLDVAAFASRFGTPLTAVGRVVAAHPGQVEVLDEGRRVAGGRGHTHFLP
jgi:thiamine monophosphate kinase